MSYEHIEVTPVAGALGAEISGVDLSGAIAEPALAEIRQALVEYLVVFFRDQNLDPGALAAFGRRFGDLHLHPFIEGLEGQPEVIRIIKTENDSHNFGGVWHSDQQFTPEPAMATALYALEVPAAGGDTLFANMYLAHDSLSEGMRRMLAGLHTHNVGDKMRYSGGKSRAEHYKGRNSMAVRSPGNVITEADHPLVRTHPESGRKALYFGVHTQHLANFTEQESRPLLEFLTEHATRPEFTCRFRWSPGALALWDNRCTQHLAINDYAGERRVMHRITICGDCPV